jgi:Tfp pilus assembly protein PilE
MKRQTLSTKHEHGFTLIELFILGVVVCVLATLVATTYNGVQAKNRNVDRQASLAVVQEKLEAYYAQNSKYPTLVQLNNPAWRQANLENLSVSNVQDPQWNSHVAACTINGQPTFSYKPTAKCYSYQASTVDGAPCVAANTVCGQYTLTASLEGGEKYVKSSLN